MHISHLHDWNVTPREAIALQKQLAGQLVLDRPLDIGSVRTVAGVDVSVRDGRSRAAVVVMSFPELRVLETVLADAPTPFPYIPGLLTFREGPVLEDAFRRLQLTPDVFIFDGAGCAHPRGVGVASHMGLWLNRPSIGCAKTRLTGWSLAPGPDRGDSTPLLARPPTPAEPAPPRIGTVLRTRSRALSDRPGSADRSEFAQTKETRNVLQPTQIAKRSGIAPVYVSPGHLMDQDSAVRLLNACLTRFRLPEPVRAAHVAAALTASDSLANPG